MILYIEELGSEENHADHDNSHWKCHKKKGKFFSLRLAKKILWYNILFKYITIIYVYN